MIRIGMLLALSAALLVPNHLAAQGAGAAATLSRLHNEYEEAVATLDESRLGWISRTAEVSIQAHELLQTQILERLPETGLRAVTVRGGGRAEAVSAYLVNVVQLESVTGSFDAYVANRDAARSLIRAVREQSVVVRGQRCCCCDQSPSSPSASLAWAFGFAPRAAIGDRDDQPFALVASTNLPGSAASKLSGELGASKLGAFLSENVTLDILIPTPSGDRGRILSGISMGIGSYTLPSTEQVDTIMLPPDSFPPIRIRRRPGPQLSAKLSLSLRSASPHFLAQETLDSDPTLAGASSVTIPGLRVELFSPTKPELVVALDWAWPRAEARAPKSVVGNLLLADAPHFRSLARHRFSFTFEWTAFR